MRGIRSTSHLTASLPFAPGSPRFRGLPSAFEDEVPRTRDDDDVTLESLPDESGDTGSMSGHLNEMSTSVGNTDDKTPSSLLIGLSEMCSIQLLKGCVQNDILVLISQYYQKRGIATSVNISYSEIAFDMKKGPSYWRFDFTCPIDGTLYHSSLPGPLFDSNPDEALVDVAKKVFGEYVIIENRQVVFLTKKGAKRSVALVVLLELGVINLPQEGSSGVSVIPTSNGCKRQSYPKWVDQLHRLGIVGSDLKITYREEYQGDMEWNCQGMCLRCVLEIEHPLSYTAEGDPRPTKQAALDSTVDKLVDFMHHIAPMMNGVDNGLETKQRLLACDSMCASYVPPLPTSCNFPLPSGKDCDSELYVYELEFEGESSKSFVQERSGIDESVTTPIGIAFTKIVDPAHHCGVYETQEFFVPRKDGEGTERVVVRLHSRVVLHVNEISGSRATSADRIFWMEEFNRTLYQWKNYGRDRRANKISETIKAKKANKIALSSLDRTYFFVPLTIDRDIDWALLQRVASYTRLPYMESIDDQWRIPFLGRIDLAYISFRMFVFGLALFALGLYSSMKDYHVYEEARQYHRLERWTLYRKLICGLTLLAASFLDRLIRCVLPPKKLFSSEMLANHLLVQAGAKNAVYVTCGDLGEHDERLTGLSSFLIPKAKVTQNKLDYFKRNFNLDLRTASFAEYYKRKYGTILRYPKEALLPCINLDGKEMKHSDFDFLLLQQRNDGYAHLAPELVHVLPMPRHFMYLARHAKDFMPLLEREIQLARASEVLRNIGTGPLKRVSSISSTWLSASLKEATTLAPETTYQRLEFLGDAVLAFFVAIVILARNSTLQLTYRAIGNIFGGATSNRVLYDAALRIGVARLLHTNQVKWRSAFALPSVQSPKGGKNYRTEVSDKHLSDVVESLLGVAFIHDSSCTLELSDSHNGIAVSLLQKLELPIRSKHFAQDSSFSAYDAIHPCLKRGYPFNEDEAWQCQLVALGVFLDSENPILDELETRRKALMDILVDSSGGNNSKGQIASKTSRTLLFCALFHNDDDDDDNESTREQNADNDVAESGGKEGMRRLINFREMLHLVGAYALQLCITNELYKRYPKASERDMHIMRACAMSDDVVVYIMMKTGIQATVYGVDPKTIQRFQLKMMIADGTGSEGWKARGGWILHGGVEEYARRRRCGPSIPQYVGIGGGRLHGKKNKLPLKDTEELMFSMKAIIGALVLSSGVDSMWKDMCPLFEELLLLSADDLTREYSNYSTIWAKG